MNNMLVGEKGYLKLVRMIMRHGNVRKTRNGELYSIFGSQLRFSLSNHSIPILTTKKMAIRSCIEELLWFIRGDTNVRTLQKKNVHIWDKNAEDLEQHMGHPLYGDLGPIYGYQWRNFNGQGYDQLNMIVEALKDPKERFSRRLIMSAWNPSQLYEMALPPCHILSQFYVTEDDKLSCQVYQRSGDMGLGVPFNIMSYGVLTHLLAKHTNLKPDKLILTLGDAHVYPNHVESLVRQTRRKPHPFPWLHINHKRECIEDYRYKDMMIQNYKYHPKIKMDMIV